MPISPLMTERDRRRTERLLLTIPIRVMAFGGSNGAFTEDTQTVEINRAGGRITLKHRVAADDTLRIVNLENFREADFRVAGATRLATEEDREWGVECLEDGHSIWGIEFPPPFPSGGSQAGALLECRGCGQKKLCLLSFMELEVLDGTGAFQRACTQCGQFSSWGYTDRAQPPDVPPATQQAPLPAPPQPEEWDRKAERRAHRRLPLKMTLRVRNQKGEYEISKTENVSKGGFATCLSMNLALGEVVTVICPYTEGAPELKQKAEVRRRRIFTPGVRWLYGFRYLT